MNDKILFGIGGIVAGVIIVSLLGPATQPRSMMFWGNNSNDPASGRTVGMMGNIDKHFIEQMIPHHDGAIAMATLALKKAARPEIKGLAEVIVRDQNKEIADMKDWYMSWFQTKVPSGNLFMMGGGMMSGSGMHMGGQEEMQILENASDFDRAFIEAMIPHHQLAVMMAQMLRSGTDRPEMFSLANNIIESQSKEIQEMQAWYESWYN